MSNADTIKSIEDNLSALIIAQGFNLEDSSTDKTLETKPLCALRYLGEDFGAGHGERPLYNEIRYSLKVGFNDKAPASSRDKIADWMHKFRQAVTVASLNVGALAASKLVSWVNHEGYDVTDYKSPITELDYRLRVRYREL